MAKKETEEKREEMTLKEARMYRASLYKPSETVIPEHEKREQFRVFWAKNRTKYGSRKNLEEVLWVHLVSSGNSNPENFQKGLEHFGLKKVR